MRSLKTQTLTHHHQMLPYLAEQLRQTFLLQHLSFVLRGLNQESPYRRVIRLLQDSLLFHPWLEKLTLYIYPYSGLVAEDFVIVARYRELQVVLSFFCLPTSWQLFLTENPRNY